jgi:hypothetical protein
MHHQDSSGDHFPPAPEEDARVEARVLDFLLDEHPGQATEAEVRQALIGDSQEFSRRDAIERAVRELVAGGLAHRHGAAVIPSRAARYFKRLGEEA